MSRKVIHVDYLDTRKIREMTAETGLKGKELAIASGIGWELIRTMYRLPYRPYYPKTLEKLVKVFNCSPADLTVSREHVLSVCDDLSRKMHQAEQEGRTDMVEEFKKQLERIKEVL